MSTYEPFIWIGLFIAIIFILFNRWSKSCPSCKRWGVKVLKDSEFLNSWDGYETITRRDNVRNTKGEITHTIERKEQVAVRYSRYRNSYNCKNCNHNWDETATQSYQY
jgi:hypothetical protein